MIKLLISRCHWLASAGLMVVRFKGRHSGKVFSTPVGFHEIDGNIIVMVSDAANRQWWRNFRTENTIDYCLRGKWQQANAFVLHWDSAEYKDFVEASFNRTTFITKIFSIDYDFSTGLTKQQIESLSSYAQVVRIKLPNNQ